MINIQKYNNLADYTQDQSRPADECAVSQIDNGVKYDGVNVILKCNQLDENDVCCVFIDTLTGERVFVPIETLDISALDERYTLQPYVLFGMAGGKKLYISGVQTSAKWAEDNWYKLECDLTANGGFDWAITVNGTAKSGTVAWTAGDTLDDVRTQLQTGAVANRLIFTHNADENFIRITVNNYSNSTFTLSNNTGATLTDLSTFCKIGGVDQTSAHHQWQGVAVKTMFGQYVGATPSTTLYGQNRLNMSYRAGGNLAKYKQYYRTNGSATYVAEASGRMSEQGFANLDGSSVAGAQDLYDKYNGSWDAYMEAGMVWMDATYRSSMEFKSYDDGKACNDFLASVTTMNFEGEYVPAFPAAALAAQTAIAGEAGCLPTLHEMAMFMRDERMARINTALSAISGSVKLSNSQSNWSLAEYNAILAWLYIGTYGYVGNDSKYGSYGVRPVLASNA